MSAYFERPQVFFGGNAGEASHDTFIAGILKRCRESRRCSLGKQALLALQHHLGLGNSGRPFSTAVKVKSDLKIGMVNVDRRDVNLEKWGFEKYIENLLCLHLQGLLSAEQP